jgi:hypothetical protein
MLHKDVTVTEGIHILHAWSVADAAALAALVPVAADVGKVARQADTGVFYVLKNNSPVTWIAISASREVLTAARTYYVRTDGSNSNTGLANTAGGAFLTIQKAVDVVCGTLDLNNYNVTISAALAGAYNSAVTLGRYIGGSGKPSIIGDETTPANVTITTTSATCFTGSDDAGIWTVAGFKTSTVTSGGVFRAGRNCTINYKNMDFGACAWSHMYALAGGSIKATGNYTISGGAFAHWNTENDGFFQCVNRTITITGTPAFSQAFVQSDRGLGLFETYGNTFSGSATGKRYTLVGNSVCFTNGAATTHFPGDVAGTTASGAQYI